MCCNYSCELSPCRSCVRSLWLSSRNCAVHSVLDHKQRTMPFPSLFSNKNREKIQAKKGHESFLATAGEKMMTRPGTNALIENSVILHGFSRTYFGNENIVPANESERTTRLPDIATFSANRSTFRDSAINVKLPQVGGKKRFLVTSKNLFNWLKKL